MPLNKFHFVLSALALLFSTESYSMSGDCDYKFNDQTEEQARSFMKDNQLIRKHDEDKRNRWSLVKMVPAENGCLAAMAICKVENNGSKSCYGTSYEVLGLTDMDQIVPFEQLVSVPRKVIAKIGSNTGEIVDEPGYYYVMLRGKDAIDASKSLAAAFPYAGFSGIAVRGKKAAFDPTKDRDWQITDASYRLRRGDAPEALDVQSFQLDGWEVVGADVFWNRCVRPGGSRGKCNVAPTNQAFVREIHPAKNR